MQNLRSLALRVVCTVSATLALAGGVTAVHAQTSTEYRFYMCSASGWFSTPDAACQNTAAVLKTCDRPVNHYNISARLLNPTTCYIGWNYTELGSSVMHFWANTYAVQTRNVTAPPPSLAFPEEGCAAGEGGFYACLPETGITDGDTTLTPSDGSQNLGEQLPTPADELVGFEYNFDFASPSSGQTCKNPDHPVNLVGNPINAANGNKYQREIDHQDHFGLHFLRHYNSGLKGWTHSFSGRIRAGNNKAVVIRPDGKAIVFVTNGLGQWVSNGTVTEQLVRNEQGGSDRVWELRSGNNVEWYNTTGRITRIGQLGGYALDVLYSNGLLSEVRDSLGRRMRFAHDAQNRLVQVVLPTGETLQYAYGGNGHLASVMYGDGSIRQYLYEHATFRHALTGVVDQAGNRFASWTYDGQGRAVAGEYAGAAMRYQLQYDAAGSVSTVTDPLGQVRNLSFSTISGRKVLLGQDFPCVGCFGDASSRLVDPATGFPMEVRDHAGVVSTYQYDTVRRLPTAVTRAAGRPEQQSTVTQWHPNWRLPVLVSESGNNGQTVRQTAFDYDSLGNLVRKSITDMASGQTRVWSWVYGNVGALALLPSAMTDPVGRTWSYTHDSAGNRTSVTNPLGHVTTFAYDNAGRVLSETAPNGLQTSYAYDARGRLVQVNTGGDISSYTYTPNGQLASASLPSGWVLSYQYDAAQRLVGAQDNRGNRTLYTLDAMGNRIGEQVQDSQGNIALATGRVINNLNRVAAITGAQGQTTAYGFDANGEPISQTDPLQATTRVSLDALRRPISTTWPDNASSSQGFDALSQLTQVTDPIGVATRYERNAFGEVLRESSPDTGTTVYQRDSAGQISAITDARGHTLGIQRDALGRPTQITYSDGQTQQFSYDSANQTGTLSSVQDMSGSTRYSRDAQGRVTSKVQTINDNPSAPQQKSVAYSYAGGQLSAITYPSGLQVSYQRSSNGQLSAIHVQRPAGWFGTSSSTPFVTSLAYTALGQAKSWSWLCPASATPYLPCDSANRVFDADGRMSSSELASYQFDAAGRISTITEQLQVNQPATPTSAASVYSLPLSWSAAYDSRGRLTSLARTGQSSSFSYDANSNRLGTQQQSTGSALDLQPPGNNANSNTNGPTDLMNTLSQSTQLQGGSNRQAGFEQTQTRSWTLPTGQTQSASSSTRVAYALSEAGATTGDGLRSFSYDSAGRLLQARLSADQRVDYLHNALGQRVFKSVVLSGALSAEQATQEYGSAWVQWLQSLFGWYSPQASTSVLGTSYVYDEAGNLLGQYDNGGATGTGQQEVIWLPIENGNAIPVGLYHRGQLHAIHTDHLGTPRRITDEAGSTVWQWPLSAFGDNAPIGLLQESKANNTAGATETTSTDPSIEASKPKVSTIKATKPGIEFNLRYPGQYFDSETGTHYNYYRDNYDPTQGRYRQPDPIGLDGGMNRFGYVGGNALGFADPEGLVSCRWIGLAFVCDFGTPPLVNPDYPPNAQPNQKQPLTLPSLLDWITEMAAPGSNVVDTKIRQDYDLVASDAKLCGKPPPDRCEWLQANAKNYTPAQVKATEKAWGCRRSRAGR